MKRAVFIIARGKRPMSKGYEAYKNRAVAKALRGAFDPTTLPRGWGHRIDERIVEYPWFFSRLPAGPGTLLDAGSILNFEFLLDQPKLREKKLFIATLAPEPECFWRRGVSYVFDDLRHSCFRDGYFDWIVSISTVEHIGLDNTLYYSSDAEHRKLRPDSHLEAIRDLRRVLKPGGTLFLSVPFGARANHGWLQVFDGQQLDEMVEAFEPSHVEEHHFRYEPRGWVVSSRHDSRDATYAEVGQTRRYDPDYAAAARAVACLELRR